MEGRVDGAMGGGLHGFLGREMVKWIYEYRKE